MKFYSDKDRIVMVQTIASANTFLSSVVGTIKNRILGAFPKDYFKGVYMDTSETFQEHNKAMLYNKDAYKIPYPSITISPQLAIDNPVGGLKNILMSSPNFWVPRDLNRQYPLLMEDPGNKYKVYFSSDYTTINIMFKIVVNSFVQATNVSYWLKSRFDENTFKYLSNQFIQVEVPKPFVYSVAKIENLFGVHGDEETNKEDLQQLDILLASISKRSKPIIRKTSLNTGKQCYFFEEKENLFTLFTDLDVPEGVIRDESINGEYEINFRVQVSAWWPNAFIMSIHKDYYRFISDYVEHGGIGANAAMFRTDNTFYSTSVGSPIALDRKDAIYFKDTNDEINVGQSVAHEVLTFDKATAINHLNITYFLSDDILKTHSYLLTKNLDPSKFLNVIVRGYSYGNGELGTTDYHNLSIDFEKPIDSDIVLDIFVNRAMYESLNNEMNSSDFYKHHNAIATLSVQSEDIDHNKIYEDQIRVYLFNNPEEMSFPNIDKALRVMTMYGIGYVGVVREGDPNASDFKICMGKDEFGNDIIRCLEKV